MEKLETPSDTVEQKSGDDLQGIIDKFECMPDFVPSRKELFGIGNVYYRVKREKQENKRSTK